MLNQVKAELLVFTAVWCGPCKLTHPIIQKASLKYRKTLKVTTIDIDKEPSTAVQYNITGVPVMILLVDGNEVNRLSGVVTEQQLDKFLKPFV